METTPAQRLREAVASLADIQDPKERAMLGYELQEAIKVVTPRLRAITDRAIAELREVASLADIASLLGISRARVSQMATSKHGSNRNPPSVIYALRIAGTDRWYGQPDALPAGAFHEARWHPVTGKGNKFDDVDLEIRYGPVEDGMLPAMQVWTKVAGRPLRPTSELTELLAAQQA